MARDREVRDINDILEDKVEKIRDRVEENVDRFKERFDDVRERLDEAKSKGEEGWKDITLFTKKNPGQALGLALLVGAAVGLILFGGRRSD